MMMKTLFLSLFVISLASASLLSNRNYIPKRWTRGDRANPEVVLPVRIFLKQRNTDRLTDVLLSVSTPTSPSYGHHWSIDEILDLIAPAKEEHDRVVDWLVDGGVQEARIESFRDSLVFVAPVRVIESLFSTRLFEYSRNERGTSTVIRQWGTSDVPASVASIIDVVVGIDDFPAETRMARRRPITNTPSPDDVGYVLPTVIQNVYNLPSKYGVASKSSICLAEFQGDNSFDKNDLSYFEQQTLSFPTSVETQHIVGPYNPQPPDAESTLDVQYSTAIGMNTTMWFWTTSGWMLDFAQDFVNTQDVPLVVSMSWGWTSSAQCQIINCNGETSEQYINRVNEEFKKMGVRGVSLFASSGDQGAPGDGDAYCDNYDDPISSIFPGASPYVTSVGATMLLPDSTRVGGTIAALGKTPPICSQYPCATSTKEGVCTYPTALITTGGGFSPYAERPKWQEKAVSAYLQSGVTLPPSKFFNASNRGFPDVAALGHNYPIRLGGQWEVVDGTSASSPVFAAVVSLLNDVRLSKGKSSLGFASPLLYHMWEKDNSVFNDITSGNNKCTESCCDQYGYEASAGWDATTGLGTPDFPKMKAFVENL